MSSLARLLSDFGLTQFLLLCLVGGTIWVGLMMRKLIENHLAHIIWLLEESNEVIRPVASRVEDIWEAVKP